MDIDVLVSEVGPRDGLQSIDRVLDLETKKRWIEAEAAAGVREIEVGSFVNYKLLPQMADTAELVEFARTIPGLNIAVLVPNAYGARAAIAAGAHKISIPVSASETHSLNNVRRTHAQMLDEVQAIRQLVDEVDTTDRPYFEAGIATAFGCTMEGHVPLAVVVDLAEKLLAAGAEEVGLSDTTGYANPKMIRDRIRAVHDAVGKDKLTGVHLHNTRGLGLANAAAALEEGITTLDSSLGGLGGCPFRARCQRQYCHRGPCLHAGSDGASHRHRSGSPAGGSRYPPQGTAGRTGLRVRAGCGFADRLAGSAA